MVSMYGTRDAALNWAEECSSTLVAKGYVRGKANPCLLWHPRKYVSIMFHGDDLGLSRI